MSDLKHLLCEMVTALCDHPDDVDVNVVEAKHTTVFEVMVNQEDLGKVIGKKGANSKAIKKVLQSAAVKQGKQVQVQIVE